MLALGTVLAVGILCFTCPSSPHTAVKLFSQFRLAFESCVPFLRGTNFSSLFANNRGNSSSMAASTVAGTSPYETKAKGAHKGTVSELLPTCLCVCRILQCGW